MQESACCEGKAGGTGSGEQCCSKAGVRHSGPQDWYFVLGWTVLFRRHRIAVHTAVSYVFSVFSTSLYVFLTKIAKYTVHTVCGEGGKKKLQEPFLHTFCNWAEDLCVLLMQPLSLAS